MGGAAVQSLARAGIGSLALADTDRFEVSNLNRQVFATLETVGAPKVEATARALASVNPELRLTTFDAGWVDRPADILPRFPVVINGMDDARAGIALYRRAREHCATVIDAYTSPLPSFPVVRPADPRPEARLDFPTVGTDWRELTAGQLDACKAAE